MSAGTRINVSARMRVFGMVSRSQMFCLWLLFSLLTATRRVNSLKYLYSSQLAMTDGVVGVDVDAILMKI